MCRWLAYVGEPIYLETLVLEPAHSLIEQSRHAAESKTETNGDGFGVGWYSERWRPGVYREVLPAWNDHNLRSLVHQVTSGLFFAHVRASTGTAVSRANCHPFVHDRWMFVHNGQIGAFEMVERGLEQALPDQLYRMRSGQTDSELIFLTMLARNLEDDPLGAFSRAIEDVMAERMRTGNDTPFRLTAAASDGDSIYAARYSSDDKPATLYYRQNEEDSVRGTTIVSEPLDTDEASWISVPGGHMLIASRHEAPKVTCL